MPSPGENTCTSPVLVTHLGHFFRIDVHICPTRREANTAIRVGVTKKSLWHVALHIFKIYGQSKIWVHFSDHNEAFGLRSLISQLFRLNLMKANKLATLAKWCSTWNSIAVSPDFLQGWDQSTRMTRMTSPSKALQFCCWTSAKCLEELHALLLTRRLEIQNALNLKLFKAPKASCWEKMGTWCYMHMPSTELFFEYKWLTPKILKHSFQRYLRKWWFKTSLDHVNICMYIKICISYIYIKILICSCICHNALAKLGQQQRVLRTMHDLSHYEPPSHWMIWSSNSSARHCLCSVTSAKIRLPQTRHYVKQQLTRGC